ncbi:hypothetical protein N3K66_004615 [Trichothecium roseum]|uniref:Uncharacterized protein n=1 Tax=Trichothecium roseum TaxID=47278 RepID=A0ACC0V1Q9_9HYPO|nr:hypothetical protein N3K66_004615 [Trichothecium roseum]
MSSSIPPFEATAVDEIPGAVETLRTTYMGLRTKDIQFRLVQLRKLYWAVEDNSALLEAALMKDLRKCKHDAILTELNWVKTEILDMVKNLEKWSKDESIVGLPITFWPMKHRIRHEPLGVVLVIGAFNYPVQLNLVPAIGAIAAGNTVLLKPSEHSEATAMVLKKIFDESLDPECYKCVNGALPVSQALLEQKYDKIVFTGGRAVGTIVAKKAAETLTPTLLELGGQNPAFVTKNTNVKMAARRLLWAKCVNAGQICLSQNYALVERSIVSEFIAELNRTLKTFMPNGTKESPDFCRIVNKSSFHRLKKMIDSSRGKIVLGGAMDEDELFIEPTVVLTEDLDDSMITEESFGPIWSIVPVDDIDQAISIANKIDPTPLALFTFGSDAENQKIINSVTSGGATINDGFTHASTPQAPLGGVGGSGNGNYHGYYSFKAFSHQRNIAQVPNWADKVLRVRYMPFNKSDLSQYLKLSSKKPNFDRAGNVKRGLGYWLGFVLGLGGKSAKGAVARWGFLSVLVAISIELKRRNVIGLQL